MYYINYRYFRFWNASLQFKQPQAPLIISMEYLLPLIFLLFLLFLVIKGKKSFKAKKEAKKLAKARNDIEYAGDILGIGDLIFDLLNDEDGVDLSLNCHELNDENIDMAIKVLTPYTLSNDLSYRKTQVIHLLLGFCYIRKEEFRKAIKFLSESGEGLLLWVAYCHTQLKDYEEAIRILQGFPDDHIESKILLAICFTNVKKYELGIETLKKIIKNRKLFESNPNKLKILQTLGEIYEEIENYTQALKCYEQIYMEDISFNICNGVKISDKIDLLKEKGLDEKRRRHIPQKIRDEVWRRDQGRCVECGSQKNLEFDHIIPVSKGGSNTARNIRLLCEECNRKKSDNI